MSQRWHGLLSPASPVEALIGFAVIDDVSNPIGGILKDWSGGKDHDAELGVYKRDGTKGGNKAADLADVAWDSECLHADGRPTSASKTTRARTAFRWTHHAANPCQEELRNRVCITVFFSHIPCQRSDPKPNFTEKLLLNRSYDLNSYCE